MSAGTVRSVGRLRGRSLAPFAILLAIAASGPVSAERIACVGNSITFGYGLSWSGEQSYPFKLDSLLGPADTAANFGNSGKTMVDTLGDSYWKTSQFPAALAFRPDQVIVELGTNDSRPYDLPLFDLRFVSDYRRMIDTFARLPTAPRILVCLVPRASNPSWGMDDSIIVNRINPAIRRIALEKGVDLVDMHSALSDRSLFQSDSVHPNEAGTLAMAKAFLAVLKRVPFDVSVAGRTLTSPEGAGYQWYRGDSLLAGDTARELVVSDTARYRVSLRLSGGSQTRIVSAFARGQAASLSSRLSHGFRISNPSRGRILLESGQPGFALEVRDLSGRLQARGTAVSGGVSLALPEAASIRSLAVFQGGRVVWSELLPPCR